MSHVDAPGWLHALSQESPEYYTSELIVVEICQFIPSFCVAGIHNISDTTGQVTSNTKSGNDELLHCFLKTVRIGALTNSS